jgi:hypothetical protein
LNLYPEHYTQAFAFSNILYPLDDSAFLAVGLLNPIDRERILDESRRETSGLTVFRVCDLRLS